MDVSQLCIDNQDDSNNNTSSSLESSSRISLPPMTEIHNNNDNDNNNNNMNVNSNHMSIYHQQNDSFKYQQKYQQQHHKLKSFSFLNQPSRTSTSSQQQQQSNDTSSYYCQQQDDNTSHSTQTSTTHHLPPPNNLGHTPPIMPLPPMSSAMEEVKDTVTNTSNSVLINQLLEQCNTIYTRIGKYRLDPLTESERSNIIDQVYFTAEKMIQSLSQLQSNEITAHSNTQLITPPLRTATPTSALKMTELHSSNSNNTNNGGSIIEEQQQQQSNTDRIKVDDMDEYKMIRQARNLQDTNSRPKYRRRSKRSMIGQRCHSCNTTETPEWRRGPDGARTLCNACGLHYSKLLRKGSMTVQTHNYMLEAPPQQSSSPSEFKRAPRIIQFPIIQVNSNNNNNQNNPSSLQHKLQLTPASIPTFSPANTSNNRITEIFDDEDMNDCNSTNNNKMDDVG